MSSCDTPAPAAVMSPARRLWHEYSAGSTRALAQARLTASATARPDRPRGGQLAAPQRRREPEQQQRPVAQARVAGQVQRRDQLGEHGHRRPWRHCLTDGGDAGAIPDLVDQDFTADAPGVKLVGDITYIPTWEGWVYLATVIDCHTKAVVGYAMDDHYKTPLISAAIDAAARNGFVGDGAVFHSDRGSNYTSAEFAAKLSALGVAQSVGRTGVCYDNALAESFFAVLKNERVHRTVYPTRRHAQRDIARYIEFRYNTKRLHSGLGYRTTYEVYDEYLNRQHAA